MKLYKDMNAEEQLKWVTDFTSFTNDRLPLLEKLGDAWEQSDRKDMETGLKLIQAFQFAGQFARNSLFFGDYNRRVSRLRYYVEEIKKEMARGLTVQGANGETYAYIPALQRRARRGRPTREEAYQRKLNAEAAQSADVKTQEKIAALLGIDVVTDKDARKKNNAELAAEKEAEKEQQEKINPSLFDNLETTPSNQTNQPNPTNLTNQPNNLSEEAKPLSEDLPHLDQVKWLLSDDLKAMVDSVRSLRATATASAERAKTLAEVGASADEIAPYAQQAQDATKQYEGIYDSVDRELATVWLRLREDNHYLDEMRKVYQLNDPQPLIKQLRPYYNKVSVADPTFTTTVRAWIDENNPEAVAERQKAEETKKKADAIIKYLRRQDKQPTKKRIQGMQEKYKELVALIGENEAKDYIPFINKTIEDNVEYERQKAERKAKK